MSDQPKWMRDSAPGWRAFQRRHGLTPDGAPGLATLDAVVELEGSEDITTEIPIVGPPRRTAGGRRIDWIVIHHNGTAGRDAADIRRWHMQGKGWSDIGYHRVYLDGEQAGVMEEGRPLRRPGAHAEDFNDHSLGYCLIGDGDERPFDEKQVDRLRYDILADLQTYGLTSAQVIGHREVNQYVDPDAHQTLKDCPGRHFDLDAFRASLAPATV